MGKVGIVWLLTGAMLAVTLLAAAPASADTQTIQLSSFATIYINEEANAGQPTFEDDVEAPCPLGFGCLVCERCVPDDGGETRAEAGIWIEDNGCDGLQKEPSDCNGDGTTEKADEDVVHRDVEV